MSALDLLKKQQEVEKVTNEYQLMVLQANLEQAQAQIDAFKKNMADISVRQKTDLETAMKKAADEKAAADKAWAEKVAADKAKAAAAK